MPTCPSLVRPALLAALTSLAACGGGPAPGPDVPGGDAAMDATGDGPVTPTDGAPDVVAQDAPTDVMLSPSGLDSRPANPTCRAFPRPTAGNGITLTRVFPALRFSAPTFALQAPGDRSRWFVVERRGRIVTFDNNDAVAATTTFVDITARVNAAGEGGLLGVAFHPNFATNRQVFLSYTAPGTGGSALQSRISRFTSRDMGRTLDPASEEIVLEFAQPFTNHNGGGIAFGPDGFLYFGSGDGGSGGDPMGNGQNPNTLLGKFLRIDVNRTEGALRYGIPADNPFNAGGGRREIFATGFRNPWRWSFDRMTGDLWAGDVGQVMREEVDVIRRGGNYGWNQVEGTICYRAGCNLSLYVAPVFDYPRADGYSITGGYVYRGSRLAGFQGQYFYTDYGSGRLWALTPNGTARGTTRLLAMTGMNVASFAEDNDGEIYLVDIAMGRLFRIDPGAGGTDMVPRTLSATGCVDMANPTRPAPGVIPYDVNAALWSDGADKERFLAIPDGQRITINADGDWDLPVGSVLIKTFLIGGRRIETRLFVRHTDGDWAGYSYEWNAGQTDATLLQTGATRDLGGGRTWTFPSRAQCLECHTVAAGRSLGLETAQLHRAITYGATGRTANQLATLNAIGMFANAPAGFPAGAAALPAYDSGAPLEARARAYLHSNCSNCHRPGGTGRGDADFRFATPLAMARFCNATPQAGDLGVAGARVLLPGDPMRSLISIRMHATGMNRMPPVATSLVDPQGTMLVDAWIRALTACP